MTQIIQATVDDLELVVPLFDAYRVFYRKSSDPEAARSFLRDRIIAGESIIYLAKKDGHPLGFTQLYPLFSSTRMGKVWLLNDLFVDPGFRGQGISLQLMDRAKDLARDTDAVGLLLETEKTNTIGNQLYPRAGFGLEDSTNHYFWSVQS